MGGILVYPTKIRFRRFPRPITDILDTSVGQKYMDSGGAGAQPHDVWGSINIYPITIM